MSLLLQPTTVGGMSLTTSIVAAPMTKCLADPVTHIPTDTMAEYYRVRKGLFHIAESSSVNAAQAYPGTPAIATKEQIEGWKRVIDAVHQNGDRIFMQLYHPGMMGRPSLSGGEMPRSPSGVAPLKTVVPRSGGEKYLAPIEMTAGEIASVVNDFLQAAKNALTAGADGVEIHAASGYLVNTFLASSTNKRQDAYGGSPEKMCRFALDIIDTIGKAIGYHRVGIRLSPVPLVSMGDPGQGGNLKEEPQDQEVYATLLAALQLRKIAYVHCSSDGERENQGLLGERVSDFCRRHFDGVLIGGGGYSIEEAEERLKSGSCDLVFFGRPILANPRFVQKVQAKEPLVPFDPAMIATPPTD
ncbi:alkene reductase [Estrella lausannensis]|uniref:NADH:flavin oxidoreductase/NADH oxidase n=1 Tax=Estrella lausannensis TaxID=483423 RepID=A0A0H5E446_9BACT|nr:alkene reductase [Estrella lausannensis]CRX38000.1 NADH:flavin oxidoreductase/NADH oxidase [Estrella lausannensis]